ncbi:MAG: hypothetical protein ACRC2B_05380, partial [Rubrivivax sp.]
AVVAGAAAAASLSLILLILGVGLGLSSVSPWAGEGIGAATFGVSTIVWLTVTQVLASAAGGYLAGRLRSKWSEIHSDEVYFRDTAHGFLAWAVASLATAAMLGSAIGSIVGSGVQAGAVVAGGATTTAAAVAGAGARTGNGASSAPQALSYFSDMLFRKDGGTTTPANGSTAASPATTESVAPAVAVPQQTPLLRSAEQDAAEIGRILLNAGRAEALPPADVRHIGQMVAQRAGLSQQEAEARVTTLYAQTQEKLRAAELAARDAADTARKASARAALWLFVSLLIGAFVASLSATFGGRQRDA